MSDSDSDDSTPIKRVSSVSKVPEWDHVPSDIDIYFKIRQPGKKSEKMLYTLKEGIMLPYFPNIEGENILV